MNEPPAEHQKLLKDIDRLLAEAPDEAARCELQSLRERLSTPEMLDMARDLESSRPRRRGELVLEFHDPLLPTMLTATGCVVATAICLFAIVDGFESPMSSIAGTPVNLWVVAAFAGAFSAMFTALSFMRSFSVRFDTEGMASRVSGARWQRLRVGAMQWKNIRSMQERPDRVLEVRSASGEIFEIPMRVVNYPILQQHLENMVRLYGDRA
jgi:hypothetical protein